MAVEGDRSAASDLEANAGPWRERLHVRRAPVERVVASPPDVPPDVVILDPPRTGVSAAAVNGLIAWKVPRVVYVSCDPPTLARDAARLVEAGYRDRVCRSAGSVSKHTARGDRGGVYILDGTSQPMTPSARVSCRPRYTTAAARQSRASSRSSFRICCRW